MRDTANGLPAPRYVLEESEKRGEAIGHLHAARKLLAELCEAEAKRGYSRSGDGLVTGYLTASEAASRTADLIAGLDEYAADVAQPRSERRLALALADDIDIEPVDLHSVRVRP